MWSRLRIRTFARRRDATAVAHCRLQSTATAVQPDAYQSHDDDVGAGRTNATRTADDGHEQSAEAASSSNSPRLRFHNRRWVSGQSKNNLNFDFHSRVEVFQAYRVLLNCERFQWKFRNSPHCEWNDMEYSCESWNENVIVTQLGSYKKYFN